MRSLIQELRAARAFDTASAVERRARVRELLSAVVRTADERSAFYRGPRGDALRAALGAGSDADFFRSFSRLPPLTKDELAIEFDALCTDSEVSHARIAELDRESPAGGATLRTKSGHYNIKKTSGTSGRLVYQVDTLAIQRTVSSLVIYRALFRTLRHEGALGSLVPIPRRSRLVIFVHRGNRSVYQGATSEGAPRWLRALLDVHIVSHEASLEEVLATLSTLQPDLVFGLPSRIEWLAQCQVAGKLNLRPRAVFFGGETFDERLLELCARAWPSCALVNTYGTTETKPIATACPECHELHVCEDIVHLELLDASGGECAPGDEAARVLATSLRNLTVPTLRYELSDRIVRLPDVGCRWKTQRIRVRGREPALLWVQDRRDASWRALDGRLLREGLLALDSVVGYAVLHDAPRSLRVTVVAANGAARASTQTAAEASVRRFVSEHGCTVEDVLDEVDVRAVDADAWHREGGKLNSIRSTVVPPDLSP